MKKIILIMVLVSAGFFYASRLTAQTVLTPIGKGCTTAYSIDCDCDGYGVGAGYVTGPDADDNDPAVNTTATVEAKYGDMKNLSNIKSFLCKARGYCNIQDIFFVAPDGDDNTGMPNDINKPFATYEKIRVHSQFGSGDLVLYRGGIYTDDADMIGIVYGNKTGIAGAPIIFMSFPGELAVLAHNKTKIVGGDSCNMLPAYYIFDTFQLGVFENNTVGYGIDMKGVQNFEFRYIECLRNNVGMRLMAGTKYQNINVLFEKSVVSQSYVTHNIYWGCSAVDRPNKNVIIRDVISHSNKASYEGFQHNGYVDGLIIESSIFHNNPQNGINILEGCDNAIIRNNLIFNNNQGGIIFFTYKGSGTYWEDYSQNNTIIGNTIWVGQYRNNRPAGGPPSECSGIRFVNSYNEWVHTGNVFKNNIFVIQGHSLRVIDADKVGHISSAIFKNNIFYMRNGGDVVCYAEGRDYTLSEFESEFGNSGNQIIDPKFQSVSVDFNLTPENFNFDLLQTSPAIDFGIPDEGLVKDLRGNSRVGNPDAGCYEYGEVMQGDINIDGEVNIEDLQLCVNVVLGIETEAGIVSRAKQANNPLDDKCDVLDVQELVNKILGG